MMKGMAATPLDMFLADLDERRGKLPYCEEISLIQRRVRKVVKTILLEVRRENPLFMTTLINSGSFYEGTKVGKPDEFDFLVQLDAFSFPEDVHFHELPCSTVLVVPASRAVCDDLKLHLPLVGPEYFEWKKTIKTPFFEILNSKAKNFEAYGMKVVLHDEEYVNDPQKAPPLFKHGPAYALLLEWNGGESDFYKGMKISVDLTIAVRINYRPRTVVFESNSLSGRVLKSVQDALPYFFAVGSYRNQLSEVQPNFFAEQEKQCPCFRPVNYLLRCSQSSFEQLLFRQEFGTDSGQSRCLRLLKVLRDMMFLDEEYRDGNTSKIDEPNLEFWISMSDDCSDDYDKLISSYVLKTVVLYEWQMNTEVELWTGSNLSQRLISILQNLVGRLKTKNLTSFFYSDYNLFKKDVSDLDFFNTASIIAILVDRLVSFKNLSEYNFEDCLAKINQAQVIICRKKKLTALLDYGLYYTFIDYVYLQKVIETSLKNEGKGEMYKSNECGRRNPIEGAEKVIVEGEERRNFLKIYIQALLDKIAPEETLALTDIKFKDLKSLSCAVKQFQDIASRRMAEHDNLPSYALWSQEHWTVEQSFYKLTSNEPKKLLELVINMFEEDIKVLHDQLLI